MKYRQISTINPDCKLLGEKLKGFLLRKSASSKPIWKIMSKIKILMSKK